MIDTDKYEGHTSGSKSELHPSGWWVEWVDPCTWYIRDPEVHLVGSEANKLLIQDAPLILADYKRLRNIILKFDDAIYHGNFDINQLLSIWHNLLTKEEEE